MPCSSCLACSAERSYITKIAAKETCKLLELRYSLLTITLHAPYIFLRAKEMCNQLSMTSDMGVRNQVCNWEIILAGAKVCMVHSTYICFHDKSEVGKMDNLPRGFKIGATHKFTCGMVQPCSAVTCTMLKYMPYKLDAGCAIKSVQLPPKTSSHPPSLRKWGCAMASFTLCKEFAIPAQCNDW